MKKLEELTRLSDKEWFTIQKRINVMFNKRSTRKEKSTYNSFIKYYNNLKDQGKDVSEFENQIEIYNMKYSY